MTESQAQGKDLEERQYLELKDDEMDIWLKLTPSTATESKELLESSDTLPLYQNKISF